MKNSTVLFLLPVLAALTGVAPSQTLPLVQDAYTSAGSGTNFGSAASLSVGGSPAAQVLVQFDLSALPLGTTSASVGKATLALFVNKAVSAGSVNVSLAASAWTEAGVNGANAPAPATAVASGVPLSAAGSYLYVDATQAVKNWIDGIAPNYGFVVTPLGGVGGAFDSKENTATSHPATLQVTMISVGPVGFPGNSGLTGPTGPQGAVGPRGPAGFVSGAYGQNTGKAISGYGRDCDLGEAILTAATVANGVPAMGQLLPVQGHGALAGLFGTRYGGDGITTFGLPDLRGATPNGLTYAICVNGIYPSAGDR